MRKPYFAAREKPNPHSLVSAFVTYTGPEGVGDRGSRHTLEKSQKYCFFSNTGPDPLKITKPPSQLSMLGHHRHASEIKWRFTGVQMMACL